MFSLLDMFHLILKETNDSGFEFCDKLSMGSLNCLRTSAVVVQKYIDSFMTEVNII